MFIFPVHVYCQIPSYHGEIFFQNVFKIYSYETLFSFNYNSYKEKKKSNMHGLGRHILRNTYQNLLSLHGFLVQLLPSLFTA